MEKGIVESCFNGVVRKEEFHIEGDGWSKTGGEIFGAPFIIKDGVSDKDLEMFVEEVRKMDEMNPVMYLFVNKGLGMSPGKMAAQVAHAACLAQRGSKPEMIEAWYKYGFYTKLVMQADDEEHLKTVERYLNERGIKTFIVIDEGRTEIRKHSVTALGCEVVDKNVLGPIFAEFDLYKPEYTVTVKFN